MKKLLAILLAAILAFGVCSAFAEAIDYDAIPDEMTSEDGKYPVAFVTDVGQLKDKSFNEGIYNGTKRFASENGMAYKYYQPANGSQATGDDRYDAMKAAVNGGAQVVVISGFMAGPEIEKASAEFPDVKWVWVDGSAFGKNTVGLAFREEQCGFFAGYACVKDGYTKLGFAGGGGGTNPACCRYGYGFVQGAEAAAEEAVSKAHKEGLETLKQIRGAILAFVVAFVLLAGYTIFVNEREITDDYHNYRGNEELKDYDYMDYTLIDSPEVTILDQDGITLRIMSVYASSLNEISGSSKCYRIAFSFVSKRKEPVRLTLKCVGVNGRSKSSEYIYISSLFKRNTEVLFYENVYGEWFDSIDEIVISECKISSDDGDILKKDSMETIKLNDEGYTVITNDKDMGNVIFENDKIRIRSLEKDDESGWYDLWIENLSDVNYYIEASELKVDGQVSKSYILHHSGLPAGYTLHDESVNGLDETFENRTEDAKVELSFSFSDVVDPKNDFSTGYLTLE